MTTPDNLMDAPVPDDLPPEVAKVIELWKSLASDTQPLIDFTGAPGTYTQWLHITPKGK